MTAATEPPIESGETGPDWEPDERTKFYAQRGKNYAFGPTLTEAIRNLRAKEKEQEA